MMVAVGAARANDPNVADLRVFAFASYFQLPQAPGRLDGLMVSDGTRHRIAIYWIEPYVYRDGEVFLRHADFIVTPKAVHYWIHGAPQSDIFHLPADANDPLLPRTASIEPIVRSALALMGHTADTTLEMGKFFRESRGRAEFEYKVPPDDTDGNRPPTFWDSDVQIMNAMPYGREYVKAKPSNGVVGWRLRRALDGQLLAAVRIKPLEGRDNRDFGGVFDPNTLGQWALVPEAYRTYWSFDKACTELAASPDKRISSHRLFDRIGSYLADVNAPPQVCRALDRLRFKAALETGDANCVWQATEAAVAGFLGDRTVDPYLCFLQLGSMSGKIDKQYPDKAAERLRPLVAQTVKHSGSGLPKDLDLVMTIINTNKWFTYGKLVLEEARRQDLAPTSTITRWATKLETSHLARNRQLSDPCEATPSVKQYLAQLDADPPKGTIDMNEVRKILEQGLAKHLRDTESETRHRIVEDAVRFIRLIVGEGPFVGDPMKLTQSVERFAEPHLVDRGDKEPVGVALATFLALAFCDISTAEDHGLLCSQFAKVCAELQNEVKEMLTKRGLDALVAPEEVTGAFGTCEQTFRKYVDDPLWPTFKFPFTANEQTRLINKVKLRLTQLEPLFDETSLRLKYGGDNDRMKKRLIDGISQAVQQVLPEAADLRNPPYPGVSCQYRGPLGFTATIPAGLYKETGRAKEIFKAMKYFHLGHRLDEVVNRDAQLIRLTNNTPRQEVSTDDAAQ
jgi:hypothetical protein